MITCSNDIKGRASCALGDFVEEYPKYKVAVATIVGSQAYGAPSDSSDIDIRGCFIVPTEDFANIETPPRTIRFKSEEYDVDFQLDELREYMGFIVQPNLNFLETLFVDYSFVIEKDEAFYQEMKKIGEKALCKVSFPHIQGMVTHMKKHKMNKYKEVDPKKKVYLFRELLRGILLFEEGKFICDFEGLKFYFPEYAPTIDFLMDKKIKNGFLSPDELNNVRKIEIELETRMNNAKTFGTLRVEPEGNVKKMAKDLVTQVRKDYLYRKVDG